MSFSSLEAVRQKRTQSQGTLAFPVLTESECDVGTAAAVIQPRGNIPKQTNQRAKDSP